VTLLPSIHDGHRKRLKQRFLTNGIEGFAPHEALELLLGFGIPQGNLNPTAHELISHFGSLSAVFEASYSELQGINKIGEHSACLIKLINEINKLYLLDKQSTVKVVATLEEAGEYIKTYFHGKTNEMVMLLFLNQAGKILGEVVVAEGSVNNAPINTRRVFEETIKFKATQIVVAHNHPNGLAIPSKDDINSTLELVKLLKPIGVEIIDHVIVTTDDYVSLASSKEYEFLFI